MPTVDRPRNTPEDVDAYAESQALVDRLATENPPTGPIRVADWPKPESRGFTRIFRTLAAAFDESREETAR